MRDERPPFLEHIDGRGQVVFSLSWEEMEALQRVARQRLEAEWMTRKGHWSEAELQAFRASRGWK